MSLAVGSLPQVIAPARGVLPDLSEGHDMKAAVELSVAGAGESVADNVAGGHVDRGGTGVGGERGGGAESVDGTAPNSLSANAFSMASKPGRVPSE
jgi:hypothetical protein